MTRLSLAVASAVALLAVAAPASAQEARGFGAKGGLILSVDRLMPLLSFSSVSRTEVIGGNTVKTTDAGASMVLLFGREPTLGAVHTIPRVAFDYAVIDHLTVGGSFALGLGLSSTRTETSTPNAGGQQTSRKNDEPRTTIVGFVPRVGYVIPLSDHFAFWPRVGFAFYSVSTTRDVVDNAGNITSIRSTNDTTFSLDLDPQFVWVPIKRFFFHAGPVLNIPLAGSHSRTDERGPVTDEFSGDLTVFHFGIAAGLGGWFDL